MNEQLIHFIWHHRFFPLHPLTTTKGETVEVIDVGLPNHDAGPDFFNAKVKIDGTLWVGNIEIHENASDWFRHGHDKDPAYENIILHIIFNEDLQITRRDGTFIPQLLLTCPPEIEEKYLELKHTEAYPFCYRLIPFLDSFSIHSWMNRLQIERLERKAKDIYDRLRLCNHDWEQVLFVTLARNFGFGLNGPVFESWAHSFPLSVAGKHRDRPEQIQALFLGQGGFLEQKFTENNVSMHQLCYGDRLTLLQKEYEFLKHKFMLSPLDLHHWKFLRTRPKGFPPVRLMQLAKLYYTRRFDFSRMLEAEDYTSSCRLFKINAETDDNSFPHLLELSRKTVDLLLINTVIPILFAYGHYKDNDTLCERALAFYDFIPPEDNYITRLWDECGLNSASAGDSQALIQLKKDYCDRKECLRCHIGQRYLQQDYKQTKL